MSPGAHIFDNSNAAHGTVGTATIHNVIYTAICMPNHWTGPYRLGTCLQFKALDCAHLCIHFVGSHARTLYISGI